MNLRTRAFGAPVLAVALAFLGGAALTGTAAHAADRLPSRSSTSRGGFLGVRTQELTNDLRDSYDFRGSGVLVSSVSPGSPADRLGIQDGDIITAVDGDAVDSPASLSSAIRSRGAGTRVAITVWRNGRERSLGRVELGDVRDVTDNTPTPPTPPDVEAPRAPEAPEAPEAPHAHVRVYRHEHRDRDDADKRDDVDKDDRDDDHDMGMGDMHELHGLEGLQGLQGMNGMGMMAMGRGRLGVELSDLDSDLGGYFRTRSGHGVLVTRVLDDTPAARAGIKAGDVIVEFDGRAVENGDALRRMVNEAREGDVQVRVERRGDERTFTARLGARGDLMQQRLFGTPGGNGAWRDNNGRTRVYRLRGNGDDWQKGLSDEDRAQLRKDMEQMRRDLARMRAEMREKMQKGGDDDDHHGDMRDHDKDRDNDRHDDGDDDDDDDSGN